MTIATVMRVFLIVVFLFSAATKFADSRSFEATLKELISSPALVRIGARAVPAFEALTALCLSWRPSQLVGQAGLLLLLLAFGWANWTVLSRKQTVACHCFGTLIPDDFGWNSVMRVVVLAVVNICLFALRGMDNSSGIAVTDWMNATFLSLGVLIIYALATTTESRTGKAR
ncbi:MAG TPA: MauE/DoxX family redox-associated membrane protein [Symbiobacteriaceae bacterium]|nr:MauE/DoxX family redox-associated membrane protein [Symbiobacteriaceae bacterium]